MTWQIFKPLSVVLSVSSIKDMIAPMPCMTSEYCPNSFAVAHYSYSMLMFNYGITLYLLKQMGSNGDLCAKLGNILNSLK